METDPNLERLRQRLDVEAGIEPRAFSPLWDGWEAILALAEVSGQAIWLWDFAASLGWWSPPLWQLLDLEPGDREPSPHTLYRETHPDDCEELAAHILRQPQALAAESFQCRLWCGRAGYLPVTIRVRACADTLGRPTRLVGCIEPGGE